MINLNMSWMRASYLWMNFINFSIKPTTLPGRTHSILLFGYERHRILTLYNCPYCIIAWKDISSLNKICFSYCIYKYNTINLHKSSIRTLYLLIVLRNLFAVIETSFLVSILVFHISIIYLLKYIRLQIVLKIKFI